MKSLDQIFAQLERSSFRSRFHLRGPDRAYIDQKGLPLILQHAQDFIDKRLAPAHPENDGKQTPFRGHPVFVAQRWSVGCGGSWRDGDRSGEEGLIGAPGKIRTPDPQIRSVIPLLAMP